MTRKVLVGGFASSESHMKSITETLSENLGYEVHGLTYIKALQNQDEAAKLVKGADVMTHSAGMYAINGTRPRTLTAVGPPLPRKPHSLIARAGRSGVGLMASSVFTHDRRLRVSEVGKATAGAFLEHPFGHVRSIGGIATFSAIEAGISAQDAGIRTRVAFMDQDQFFQPTPEEIERAREFGLKVLILHGHHDELLINPYETYVELEARHWAYGLDDEPPLAATA